MEAVLRSPLVSRRSKTLSRSLPVPVLGAARRVPLPVGRVDEERILRQGSVLVVVDVVVDREDVGRREVLDFQASAAAERLSTQSNPSPPSCPFRPVRR